MRIKAVQAAYNPSHPIDCPLIFSTFFDMFQHVISGKNRYGIRTIVH